MLFVTSDYEQVKEEAKRVFGAHKVLVNPGSNLHINFQLDASSQTACAQMEKILLDFWLLKECDMAVVSHSGFGLLGTWNRKIPNENLYVYTNQEIIKQRYWQRENLHFVKLDDLNNFFFY